MSANQVYKFIMQTDGNLVVYKNGVGAIWASSSCGQTGFSGILAVMQTDGNFVLYPGGSAVAVWATSWPQTQPGCSSNQQTVFGSGVTYGHAERWKPRHVPSRLRGCLGQHTCCQ